MNYIDYDPVGNLLKSLAKNNPLPDSFDLLPKPCLIPDFLKKIYQVQKTQGVFKDLYWLDDTYARGYKMEEDKEGLPIERTVAFYRSRHVLIDPSGFFMDKEADFNIEIAKGGCIVRLSSERYDLLKVDVPELQTMAIEALSEYIDFGREKKAMMRLMGEAKYLEFIRLFGAKIESCFHQKEIADYLGWAPEYLNKIVAELKRKKLI